MGRTSTHVGTSDKRGILVPRTRHVLACVAEHEMAATALYGQPVFTIWEGDRANGNLLPKKKNAFPSPFLSFPDQTKWSILCRNHLLYLLSV